MSYPWLREPWLRLIDSAKQQRLAHAYYLRHAPEQGSDQFLQTLANFLLCQQPDKSACGQCKSCKLYQAGSHPDFWHIDAREETSIGIDEVRKLQNKLLQTANQGGARVAILTPADKLTEQASNAILKVLEEPPANMFWLISVQQPEQLLPTLRSRMQWINLQLPALAGNDDHESANSLLSTLFAGALPPVIKDKSKATEWLDITERLLLDLSAATQSIASARFNYTELQPRYRDLTNQHNLHTERLLKAVDECRQLRQRYRQSKGLNLPLLLSLCWQQWTYHGFNTTT